MFYTHDLYTEKAIDFIRDNRENPFFLYLSYTIPHFSDYPKDSPDHYLVPSNEPYSKKDWPQIAKNYAAMITRMDSDVGRITALIKEFGLDSNTIIFFTSDNGPYKGVSTPIEFFDSNGVLRGGKRDLYEGGIRVPFIARWPGEIPAGVTNDQIVAFWDIPPTLAQIAGLPAPSKIDGISILPSLLGQKQKQHEYLYWDYGHVRKTFKQAIRMDRWKAVRIGVDEPLELYHLRDDPGETTDLAAKHPEIVTKIESLMEKAYAYSPDYPVKGLNGESYRFKQSVGKSNNKKK